MNREETRMAVGLLLELARAPSTAASLARALRLEASANGRTTAGLLKHLRRRGLVFVAGPSKLPNRPMIWAASTSALQTVLGDALSRRLNIQRQLFPESEATDGVGGAAECGSSQGVKDAHHPTSEARP